jgi:hypothetical protein
VYVSIFSRENDYAVGPDKRWNYAALSPLIYKSINVVTFFVEERKTLKRVFEPKTAKTNYIPGGTIRS